MDFSLDFRRPQKQHCDDLDFSDHHEYTVALQIRSGWCVTNDSSGISPRVYLMVCELED